MGKYPIYAIVALVFIGIVKLLQVTAFDAEQYTKNKKANFGSKPITEKSADKKIPPKENPSTFKPTKPTPQNSEDAPTTILDQSAKDSTTEAKTEQSFEPSQPVKAKTSYENLSDLKNNYLAPKLAGLPPGQLREDVVIRYYRHDKDGDKIYSLRDLGYYIHEKEATETAGLGSNVLYYGSEVAVEDIQIVAYTLLEVGLPLKSIQPTQFKWKSTSLEVGTDTLLLNDATLTDAEIKNFNK